MGPEVTEKGGPQDRARIVRRYLSALDARKPGRSPARTAESVQHRMHQIDTHLLSADPIQRLHLTQERIDLHAELLRLHQGSMGDFETLEKSFVRVAKAYGDRHDVTYSAWRQIGVDAEVLAQAGIHQAVKPARQSRQSAPAAGAPAAGSPESAAGATEPPATTSTEAKSARDKTTAKAGDAEPAGAKPSDAKTGEAKTGGAKKHDAKPGDAKSSGPKPGDAKPTGATEPDAATKSSATTKSPGAKKSAPKKPAAKKQDPSNNGAAAKPAKKAAPPAQSEQQQLPAEAHLLS